MSDMSLSGSDLSSLSSAPPTDDEAAAMVMDEPAGIAKYFKKESESPPAKRSPSPPHEYVLADNPNIAFIVMFRARFHDVFPRSLPHYGPQDIEKGVADITPGDYIERLLCALIGLVLNRKKDVERNHYQRPLEEAIQTHVSQWPKVWEGKSPLHGGITFATMSPEERLNLLRALILWSLSSSDAVQAKIKESYKQTRHDDDLNQPLSVQSWGRDSLKRRYWLVEGQDDTHFRLYRESNPQLKNITWWSVAGTIPELKTLADKLDEEKNVHSRKLSEKINNAIPRFEGSEEKRKRRDYRIARKAAFSRPDPGFSLYEGRTRGKKLKYTYSDDEDFFSDDFTARRSTRNSTISTPTEPAGPKYTTSGRQVRSRAGGIYGEALLSGQRGEDSEEEPERTQRTRAGRPNGYMAHDSEEPEFDSDASSSGNEWQGGDDEEENEFEGDDEEDLSGDEEIANGETPRLVVQLRYNKNKLPSSPAASAEAPRQNLTELEETAGKPVASSAQPTTGQVPKTAPETLQPDAEKIPTPLENGVLSSVIHNPGMEDKLAAPQSADSKESKFDSKENTSIPFVPQSQAGPVDGPNGTD
ncbi:hypothetical protein ASPZODRAFT_139809 [Penicilliopsis zonata CBS 506.65]|uniref:WHIM1 domain-containing protein n=1 Tax=Penicilliopsis zonata CBS 506.65 TaxID=1073090 RepID=A0A1L9SP26_9EURO|nr:hypothetical protein ASPZODRAFT_139809 [Penicilliopsis zonata CBS 506.65]OJJ48853.1 hypothetical protein ASPZODRAFT_139809 [Penicilliopsis zonata CBS 506.65]